MNRKLLAVVLISIALQACGSSNKSTTEKTISEVHGIQPAAVAAYISDFKLQHEQLKFEFNKQASKMSFIELDVKEKEIIVKYNKGLVFIGFDIENNKAIASLTLAEGDTSDLENFESTRALTGVNIEITKQGNNTVYSGLVVDVITKYEYPIYIVFNESLINAGDSTVVINGTKATISGTLGTSTYIQIQDMLKTKSVDTLILSNVEGSVNDDINMHTGRLIRAAQLTTLMPKDGEAYSGGVDLFAAGSQRIFQDGGKLGVHSWCCEKGKDAGQLSKNNPAHDAQLTYFREMLGTEKGPEFYFFTINSAPADGIHLMTKDEMIKYSLVSK
ncbi:MAG: hypothetical protein HRU25_07020 [Psychrobium sp.]|nr:hypothetical protein [Psychrobium sp.]